VRRFHIILYHIIRRSLSRTSQLVCWCRCCCGGSPASALCIVYQHEHRASCRSVPHNSVVVVAVVVAV